jgi:hypothetical protein
MRVLLRFISTLVVLGTASNAIIVASHWGSVRSAFTLPWGMNAGILAAAGVLALIGVYAAAILWDLRNDGRVLLAAVLTSLIIVSALMLAVSLGNRSTTVVRMCVEGTIVGVLLSPDARKACARRGDATLDTNTDAA